MTARAAWLLALACLLLSETLGHALVARMVDPGGSHHRLASGDLEYAPLAFAAFLVVAGALLLRRAFGAFRADGARPLPGWKLVAVPAPVFLLQEHVERVVHEGELGQLAAVEPVVLVGLGLQLPCGLLALWLVRSLLRAADRLGWALARRSGAPSRRPPHGLGRAVHASPLRLPVLASRHAGRAPPALA